MDQGRSQIVIEAEHLQDTVFENLNQQHQMEMDKIFYEAKAEIDRLTSILFERDNEIQFLKS